MPEALWTDEGEVVPLPSHDDEEVTAVLARALRQAREDWASLDARGPKTSTRGLRPGRCSGRWVAVLEGHDRAGLGRLCRYGARGPVSEERLEDGRYRYTPKKAAAFTVTAAEVSLVQGTSGLTAEALRAEVELRRRCASTPGRCRPS